MNEDDPPRYVDVSGPTLQDAIEQGLSGLGLTRNDVIIEIIEEGGGTLSGGGSSEAVVRLTPLRRPAPRAQGNIPTLPPRGVLGCTSLRCIPRRRRSILLISEEMIG